MSNDVVQGLVKLETANVCAASLETVQGIPCVVITSVVQAHVGEIGRPHPDISVFILASNVNTRCSFEAQLLGGRESLE